MTSLPGHFRPPEVTWRHFLSCDCLLLRATALQELKCTAYASSRPSTATSWWLPVKWRHFRITSVHLRSRDVISCRVIASSCELQPCRNWNVQYTPAFAFHSHFQVTSGQMTSLPGHFRSPEVTWRRFLSRDCLHLRATALQGVKCTVYTFSSFYSHFHVTSGQMTSLPGHFRLPEATWRHFLSRDCFLQRATAL